MIEIHHGDKIGGGGGHDRIVVIMRRVIVMADCKQHCGLLMRYILKHKLNHCSESRSDRF